jgi:hypothetical protein
MMIVITIIVGLLIYEIFIPELVALQHQDRVARTIRSTESTFRSLGDSTYLSILDNPSEPFSKKQADIAKIKSLLVKAKSDIETLRNETRQLDTLPYSGYTDNYNRARIQKDTAEATTKQVESALREYSDLIVFLESYNAIENKFSETLNGFNAIGDVNTLAGKGDEIRTIAKAIHDDAVQLEKVSAPHDFMRLRSTTVDVMKSTAAAYDELARGLDSAVDSTIYDAVTQIEASSLKLDSDILKLYSDIVQQSRTIKDIRDLLEKLDALETS